MSRTKFSKIQLKTLVFWKQGLQIGNRLLLYIFRNLSYASRRRLFCSLDVQLFFLAAQQRLERDGHLCAEDGDGGDVADSSVEQVLVEGHNDKDLLDVHLDDGLADQSGAEKSPEGDEEVAAGDAGQIEQGIGDLGGGGGGGEKDDIKHKTMKHNTLQYTYGGAGQNSQEPHLLHNFLDSQFCTVKNVLKMLHRWPITLNAQWLRNIHYTPVVRDAPASPAAASTRPPPRRGRTRRAGAP
jgi:hypothetical protein